MASWHHLFSCTRWAFGVQLVATVISGIEQMFLSWIHHLAIVVSTDEVAFAHIVIITIPFSNVAIMVLTNNPKLITTVTIIAKAAPGNQAIAVSYRAQQSQ